jgi:uncharacterized repeat protein (TIGR01451 family)
MKNIYLLFSLCCISFTTSAQLQNQWVWVQGTDQLNDSQFETGFIGVEDETNWPGARAHYAGVSDPDGNFYMFGEGDQLWMYNTQTNNFTFKKGSFVSYYEGYSKGINVEHFRNRPAQRGYSQMWINDLENIYLFSGEGQSFSESQLMFNDFWKYNIQTGNWTQLIDGSLNPEGNYGTQGVLSPDNVPPGVIGAATWTDNEGNLWMFSGIPFTINSYNHEKHHSAMWKYDIAAAKWVWMSGVQTSNAIAVYDSLGNASVANFPGSRINAATWTDAEGNLWLYGGAGPSAVNAEGIAVNWIYHNDLWKYSPVTNLWTWIKGSAGSTNEVIATTGTENPANMPQGNHEKLISWKDNNGNFWLYGTRNDQMWKYNPATNNWTLVKGSTASNIISPVYGEQGIANAVNTPGERTSAHGWTGPDGNLYFFSGADDTSNSVRDLWKYTIADNTWTWIKGCGSNQAGVCELKVKVESFSHPEVNPGATTSKAPHWQDSEGNLWVHGSDHQLYGQSAYFFSYLWKFNSATKQWQWMDGKLNWYPEVMPDPVLGAEHPDYDPGYRINGQTWTDLDDNLWLFGGNIKSDLWRYNKQTKMWAKMHGPNITNVYGTYGSQGMPAPQNVPGSREDAVTWVDDAGNLWLFGGEGYGATTGMNKLNDLWKYDISTNQWIWMKGSNEVNGAEVSNGIGFSDAANTPPSSNYKNNGWKDNDNNLWLYVNNSVWKYNIATNMWSKMKAAQNRNYGVLNVASNSNSPGLRRDYATWKEPNGDLILYGGMQINFSYEFGADLWKYSIASNMWTWIGGSKVGDMEANYGEMGEVSYNNIPGSRFRTLAWSDNNGNRYLYGGQGFEGDEFSNFILNDVWMSNGQFNTITGNIRFDATGNGCDASDVAASAIKVNIMDGDDPGFTFTDENGNYTIFSVGSAVTIMPESIYFTASPASQTFNFTGYQNTSLQDFCLTSQSPENDLEITVIPLNLARPGFNAFYKVIYKNVGNTTLSGTVDFAYSDEVIDIVTSAPVASSVSTGTLQWLFTNLQPFQSGEIMVTANINTPMETPPVNDGDILPFTAVINTDATDETIENNTFELNQGVVNSLDPNDKTCLEGDNIDETKVGEYVTYLIRFENTGTANAVNIIVKDVIDISKFDINTIEPVDASHPYRFRLTSGNVAEFIFEGINLSFSQVNNQNDGYVSFRIKTKATLEIGDIFENEADIYFDYNFPIITNVAYTEVTENLSVDKVTNDNVIFYPNPVKDKLFLTIEQGMVQVFDVSGRIVMTTQLQSGSINLNSLVKGAYYIKITNDEKSLNLKILKE